jgi:hypothetical protein
MHVADDPTDPLTRLSYEPVHHLMDSLILGHRRDDAIEHLRNYFDTDLYTGRWFDRLDGGGDRPDVANRITTADLAALTATPNTTGYHQEQPLNCCGERRAGRARAELERKPESVETLEENSTRPQ